jgi:predicted DCC family thiol-disulfide oxidoreductase YuxK
MKATVLYDDACPLCRTLAEMVGRRAEGRLCFESWQTFSSRSFEGRALASEPLDLANSQPDRIHILVDGQMYAGVAAWEYIVNLHPDFVGLTWLAQRLGLTREIAHVVQSTAALLKRFCFRCPK